MPPSRGLGRGSDHCSWCHEEALSGGKVAPFDPNFSPNPLKNALKTAFRDLFFTKIWAGHDVPEPPEPPEALNFPLPGVTAWAPISRYDEARDVIVAGWSVIARSETPFGPHRDRHGYCTPAAGKPAWLVCRGASDGRRPALIWCGPGLPGGPERVKLPHGVWITLPQGCFLADADYTPTRMWAIV